MFIYIACLYYAISINSLYPENIFFVYYKYNYTEKIIAHNNQDKKSSRYDLLIIDSLKGTYMFIYIYW